ncbi:DNA repair protein RAD5 [Colletotrichum orchidophilum]|uniref:DNA repair protein RAD5 n=1 Tax=Colletotrichum orchidophilum TaxID=1209926 RepID=A0A1G4AX00_9PEZI|nr:DNA repair protein RAD5 [Colletotrichum orchidophilum]OHE93646.1 DNA repair protein RAD5 [Colletotrichum orchidophilum]
MSGSRKRKGNGEAKRGRDKKARRGEHEAHPLDSLLGGARRARVYNSLQSDAIFRQHLEKELREITDQLDNLAQGVAQRPKLDAYTKATISSLEMLEKMLTALTIEESDTETGSTALDNDNTDAEIEETAFQKARQDLEKLIHTVEDSFCDEQDDYEIFFRDHDIQYTEAQKIEEDEKPKSDQPSEAGSIQRSITRTRTADPGSLDGRSLVDRDYVRFRGEWVHIDEFLGDKWKNKASAIHNISLPFLPPIPGLKTSLTVWQRYGVKKMLRCIEEFKGCILADEMGMGKTLTCIITALLYRKSNPTTGFILVGKAPKFFVLEDARTTAEDIIRIDPAFVLVTWGFIKSRHNASKLRRALQRLSKIRGFGGLHSEYSSYLPQGNIPERENEVLHSDLYDFLGKSSIVCILDEAQLAKNQETVAHQAVLSLPIPVKIPVSGSIIHNTWADGGGIVAQTGLGIFNNVQHFQNMFSVAGKNDNSGYSYELAPERKNHLLRLLLTITISRSASLLQLPNREEHVVDFTISDAAVALIGDSIAKFFKVCHMPKTKGGRKAILHMVKAQKHASNQLLLIPIRPPRAEYGTDSEGSQSGVDNDEDQDSEASYHADESLSSDDGDTEESDGENEATHDESDGEHEATHDESTRSSSEVELESDIDIAMHDDEDETDTWTDSEKVVWERILKNASNEDVLSPRVSKILECLQGIFHSHPGEKIIIFSTYVRFLDIIELAIHRNASLNFHPLRFDGSVGREERDRRATEFDENPSLPVMMVSKGAGGVGMDLTVASHIIQCEAWWNGNDEAQAHFRCWRGGQTRKVHIWRIMATNSAVDHYIVTRNQQKMNLVGEFMSLLRRNDEDAIILPRLFTKEDEEREIEAGTDTEDSADDP